MATKDPYNVIVGRNIKSHRLKLSMTRDELASLLGYKTGSSIAKLENGSAALQVKDLPIIANVLRCDIVTLVGGVAMPGMISINTNKYGTMLITLNEAEADALMDSLMPNLQRDMVKKLEENGLEGVTDKG